MTKTLNLCSPKFISQSQKYIPLKFNPSISIFLWVVILFLGYNLYKSIIGPVEFNQVKRIRYAKVIENLKDIRISELAYQEIEGKFSGNFPGTYETLIMLPGIGDYTASAISSICNNEYINLVSGETDFTASRAGCSDPPGAAMAMA